MTTEQRRLLENRESWIAWGPYLSEGQWGTVREDYSYDGNAWSHFTHDAARRRAYRWGEDGIGGFSDSNQRLCLSVALWNGRDAILKERLFGLTNAQGNHGEDVKELYYYLDATPSHSYLKMLYKYPQAAFPYAQIVNEAARRNKLDPEFELIDTGLFDDDRYFDVVVEYAKASPNDILMRVTAINRGPDPAQLTVLPHIWYRNTWSWDAGSQPPTLTGLGATAEKVSSLRVDHPQLEGYHASFDAPDQLLFCNNETRHRNQSTLHGAFKDAFHEYVVNQKPDALNSHQTGSKAAGLWKFELAPSEKRSVRMRLAETESASGPFGDFDDIFDRRIKDADEFFADVGKGLRSEDERRVQRQALAGMVWTKQYYEYDVSRWLDGDPAYPPPPASRHHGRNAEWVHLHNHDIISMPDKWEYPWYAAWDSAFHCLPFTMIDTEFAKEQLLLFTKERYMHPNGQLPAYEWKFEDVNPPVHAWATWRVFEIEREQRGGCGDLAFLERVFHKMMLYFTWWVNRKDAEGHNIFQGGFLGLDNIGVFDRSSPLPNGGYINQADGTSWMAMFSLKMMRMALELARHNPVYQDIAIKFFEHFLHIAKAMTNIASEGIGLWDEETEFYYDVLYLSDGQHIPLRVRSLVGLAPLFAVETLEPEILEKLPEFRKRLDWLLTNRPDLAKLVSRWHEEGRGHRHLLSLLRGHRMKCLLRRMLDPNEFLSDYGVRGLSKHHEASPFEFHCSGQRLTVGYQPAESDTQMFGGNSNWRGPIWFPVNYLLIESMHKFHHYYGDDFKIECPTGSGNYVTIEQAAQDLAVRLKRIFLRDGEGRRAVLGQNLKFQQDPHFRDFVPFYEYFHGDNGRGVGASHQTGWTGLIANLLRPAAEPKAVSPPCPKYVAEFVRP